jgi:hypothetical protein
MVIVFGGAKKTETLFGNFQIAGSVIGGLALWRWALCS